MGHLDVDSGWVVVVPLIPFKGGCSAVASFFREFLKDAEDRTVVIAWLAGGFWGFLRGDLP